MWFPAIFSSVATLLLVFGVLTCNIIIHYFRNKNDLHKTALDRIMVDTVWSFILVISMFYLGGVLVICSSEEKYSYGFVLGFYVTYSVVKTGFVSASLVTISTKLCYIQYSGTMLEASDMSIYWYSMLTRVALMAFVTFLNALTTVSNKPPIEFMLYLKNPNDYVR